MKIEGEVEAVGPVRKVVPKDYSERKALLLRAGGADVACVVFGEVGRVFFGELRGYFPVKDLKAVLQSDEIKIGDRVAWELTAPARPVGRPSKINGQAVRDAIRRLGPRATVKNVADELGVGVSTLEQWRKRQGYADWKALREEAA